MSSNDERRRHFAAYKRDVDKNGKSFFPHAMFHDTVMSLIVVSVIIGLAIIWHEGADGTEAGHLGPLYGDKADPATTSFTPRPDWYFYFLFYLLRIFKWPNTVVIATVGIPTILMMLLFALPFLDRRIERRLTRRPVAILTVVLTVIAMGTLTWKGATASEFLASDAPVLAKEFQEQNNLPDAALPGAELFAESGCLNCHTYLNYGSTNLGAPDLTAEGTRNRGIQWQIDHLINPSSKSPGSPMPSFAGLGDENLRNLAIFLEASKGPQS
jgi:ubiquinol-cytochrome c reductase cytochrome b subunit/menaquinol-cytochrome c reductase cytochrome b/c subunit